MHAAVMDFCRHEVARYQGVVRNVLEVGSFDMNGTTRILFGPEVRYFGLDVTPGKGVDWVGLAHEFPRKGWDGRLYDVMISTEALEHDPFWEASLTATVQLVRPGGLVVLTCASGDREPHHPMPGGYYRNLFAQDVVPVLERLGVAVSSALQVRSGLDLQVVGMRRSPMECLQATGYRVQVVPGRVRVYDGKTLLATEKGATEDEAALAALGQLCRKRVLGKVEVSTEGRVTSW